jgi:hypothetical protein
MHLGQLPAERKPATLAIFKGGGSAKGLCGAQVSHPGPWAAQACFRTVVARMAQLGLP